MMEDNDKYGVSNLLLKIKLLLLKLKKEKKNISIFFYLTNPYHFANSNEVKHDNYFVGLEIGMGMEYGPWPSQEPNLKFHSSPHHLGWPHEETKRRSLQSGLKKKQRKAVIKRGTKPFPPKIKWIFGLNPMMDGPNAQLNIVIPIYLILIKAII